MENTSTLDTLFSATEEKMKKTVSLLANEYAQLRAGRANISVLDKIRVDYYGTPTPINQMAAISVSEARILIIQPWDKSTIHSIEKAIQTSDIGINPQNDGIVIRLIFPQLTEEHRKELGKDVRKMAEDSRIAVRAIRRDAIEKAKKMEKASEITEDDLSDAQDDIQDYTDKYIKEIDKISEEKDKEIMSV